MQGVWICRSVLLLNCDGGVGDKGCSRYFHWTIKELFSQPEDEESKAVQFSKCIRKLAKFVFIERFLKNPSLYHFIIVLLYLAVDQFSQ